MVSKVRGASRGSHLASLILQEPVVVSPYSSNRAAQDCTIGVWDLICYLSPRRSWNGGLVPKDPLGMGQQGSFSTSAFRGRDMLPSSPAGAETGLRVGGFQRRG